MDRIEVVKSYMQVDISMAKENNSHASSTHEEYVYVYLDDADLLLTALAEKDKRIEEATSQVISLLAKTGGVEYRNRLEAILAALGKEG